MRQLKDRRLYLLGLFVMLMAMSTVPFQYLLSNNWDNVVVQSIACFTYMVIYFVIIPPAPIKIYWKFIILMVLCSAFAIDLGIQLSNI
jgi:hypothetical protein